MRFESDQANSEKQIVQIMDQQSRREFLQFLGLNVTAAALLPSSLARATGVDAAAKVGSLAASLRDELGLLPGLRYEVLLKYGDVINSQSETFGFDCDFTATISSTESEALLWVNHESVDPLFVSGYQRGGQRTKGQVDRERRAVGGSIVKIRRDKGRHWRFVANDPLNRRLDATTKIPLVAPQAIAGSREAIGTLGNCSGGVTPWKTFLTCEENTAEFYGAVEFENVKQGKRERTYPGEFGWQQFYDLPPEHYGWVVEVEPQTGQAQKLTALGRFAHEGALVVEAKDGRCVVYMGDDANDQCLYKFIADRKGSLATGTLYVADLGAGKWLPLVLDGNAKLKATFATQTELLTWTRLAAKLVGGTPLARPEGIARQPGSGRIVVSLTNNKLKNDLFGSLLKIEEKDGDFLALEFTSGSLIIGGTASGFACPDNICFDARGNLWMTSDMSTSDIGKGAYQAFGNNSLWYIPVTGSAAGQPRRVANAPVGAELTGPSFSPDGRTLFVCVQHPGQGTTSLTAPLSSWPSGKGLPKSAVVALTGPLLERLVG